MKTIIATLCAILMLVASCDRGNDDRIGGSVFSETYITYYMFADTLHCVVDKYSETPRIGFGPWGEERTYKPEPLFEELTAHYEDYYNDDVYMGHSAGVMADEFTSIDITSDRDFDQAHPAGTPLNDISMISFYSLFDFIHSGYDRDLLGEKTKLASQLTLDDLKLLVSSMGLTFTTPIPAGTHNFTITMRTDEKTLSQTIAVEVK